MEPEVESHGIEECWRPSHPYELRVEESRHEDTSMPYIHLLPPCIALPIPTVSPLLHNNG